MLAKLRHASELWAQGDKCLAQIHLKHLRLPRLESEEQAFRLLLADRLIESGQSPCDLCRALGFDLPERLKKYNPDEPRDDHGRWTSGGASREPAQHEQQQVTSGSLDLSGAQPAAARMPPLARI